MKEFKTELERVVEEEQRRAGQRPQEEKETKVEVTRGRFERLTKQYKAERERYKEDIAVIQSNKMYSKDYINKQVKEIKNKATMALQVYKSKINEMISYKLEELDQVGIEKEKKTETEQIIIELRKQNLYKELEVAGKRLEIKEIVRRLKGLDETTIKTAKEILSNQGIDTVPIEIELPANKEKLTRDKLNEAANHLRRITDGVSDLEDNPVYKTGLMGFEYSLRYLDDQLNYID
jgi:hypothetical protein